MRFMLIGNPNSGKSTVFNHLTGGHQHIGNFPGVTVEFKSGRCGNDTIIDLPGLYSLEPHSAEEQIAVNHLKENRPDGILNCIDMTNLRRSLALTLSLMELKIPMIIIANMLEECRPAPDLQQLELQLGIPIFSIRQQNRWAPAAMIRMMRFEIEHQQISKPLCRGSIQQKYQWIDQKLKLKPPSSKKQQRTQAIDRILLHPIIGTILFLLMMGVIFDLTFHHLGPWLTKPLLQGPDQLLIMAEAISLPLLRATVQGAISGVGTVLSFLPTIMLLYFFLALLEDSGYMVRICYLSENIMRLFGLSGRSIVPLLIGFGCSVPAILSTRTMDNTLQQRRTLRMIPFISCSAKLPVYGLLSSLIAPQHTFLFTIGIYITGIIGGLILAALSPSKNALLLLEKPPYRFPKFKNLWFRLWGQAKAFVQKAFTVLLLASIAAAILQQFTPSLQYTQDTSKSILAFLGKIPASLFKPIGLGQWDLIAALIAGLFAKESIASVLMVLAPQIAAPLPFLAFILFYPPCFAAMHTLRKEAGWKFAALTFLLHFAIAYLAAFICNRI